MAYSSEYGTSGLGNAQADAYLLLEGFYTVFYDELEEEPSVFEQIYAVKSTDKRSETAFEFNGLTMAVETTHGGPTIFQDPSSGNKKELTPLLYRNGFRATEEDIEDDLYDLLMQVAKSLPRTFTRRADSVAGAVVSGVFTSTTGFDGLALAHAAHPYATGYADMTDPTSTTQRNLLATPGPPSPENLQSMFVGLRKQRTREGAPARLRGNKWICNVDNEAKMWEVLQSNGVAYSDERTDNVFKGPWKGTDVVEDEWLTTSGEYHLIDSSHTPFLFLWRVKPQFKEQTQLNNSVREYYGRMRFVCGAFDWRGLYSTTG